MLLSAAVMHIKVKKDGKVYGNVIFWIAISNRINGKCFAHSQFSHYFSSEKTEATYVNK